MLCKMTSGKDPFIRTLGMSDIFPKFAIVAIASGGIFKIVNLGLEISRWLDNLMLYFFLLLNVYPEMHRFRVASKKKKTAIFYNRLVNILLMKTYLRNILFINIRLFICL